MAGIGHVKDDQHAFSGRKPPEALIPNVYASRLLFTVNVKALVTGPCVFVPGRKLGGLNVLLLRGTVIPSYLLWRCVTDRDGCLKKYRIQHWEPRSLD